jgi:plasmid stabilization system protein ParE
VPAQLLFEAEAEHELDEATQRYDEQRPGLGQRFLDEVATTTQRVREFPRAGAPVKHVPKELGARHAPVNGFPYHVVYLAKANEIRVLAIAHYRRRPGYWLDR